MRAIFGEKAGDVRDTSLRVPPGVEGVVIGAEIFSRKGADKDSRTEVIEKAEEDKLRKDETDEIRIIRDRARSKLAALLDRPNLGGRAGNQPDGKTLLGKGKKITEEALGKAFPFSSGARFP